MLPLTYMSTKMTTLLPLDQLKNTSLKYPFACQSYYFIEFGKDERNGIFLFNKSDSKWTIYQPIEEGANTPSLTINLYTKQHCQQMWSPPLILLMFSDNTDFMGLKNNR